MERLKPVTTRRPGSSPELERAAAGGLEELVGKVMGAQVELQERVTRALDALRGEHETYTRTVVQLARTVEEMQAEGKKTLRVVRDVRALAPILIVVAEVAREVLKPWLK